MPFLYDDDPDGVFFRAGPLVNAVNDHLANATTTLPAELKTLVDPSEEADIVTPTQPLYDIYAALQDAETATRNRLAGIVSRIFQDRDSVLVPLGVQSSNLPEVLSALINRMALDTETINQTVVTVGTVTANGGNTGNGIVLASKVLDGYTPPLAGGIAHLRYAGVNSELTVPSERMTWTCSQDSGRGGLVAGMEEFAWAGAIKNQKLDWRDEGSGQGPTLRGAPAATVLTNGDMAVWANSLPSGWTAEAGSTRISQEASDVYRGTSAAKFAGDGSTATIGLAYTPATGVIRGRRGYFLCCRMKCSTNAPAAGTFELKMAGTGYSPGGSETVSVAHGSLTTSWVLCSCFLVTPATIPSNFRVVAQVSSTLTNAVNIFVDDVFLLPAVYHGGIASAVIPGSTPFVAGDGFYSDISKTSGTWQDFFRRWFAVQLPSASSGETILDSLAE